MILVDVDGVTMSRPDRVLFSDLSVTVSLGDRLGVLGVNGVGKSTLLRVMTGAAEPEAGRVRRGRDMTVAVLDQRPELGSGTVRDAVGEGWEVESILDRLGMGDQLDTPIETLSGGQAKRVALARVLVVDADLLVLDEPTNHLDIEAIEWLERRLGSRRGGLVIVTHDRQLLDRVTTRLLELDRSSFFLTDGGYQRHLELAAERAIKSERDEASRKILARQELAWISRGARARRRKPKARLTQAKAVLGAEPVSSSTRQEPLGLGSFGTRRLGDRVIDFESVAFAYSGCDPLFEDLDLTLEPSARLGVIGPNGAGKSTLLDLMARRGDPTAGSVSWGSTVQLGYFDQVGSELDGAKRVRETLTGDDGKLSVEQSQLLERFWFDRDAQAAPVATLSGGERRRLELLLVLSGSPNVLLLDEPTNDLDLDTLRALEGFLDDWSGALVVVSHDRVFLERTVERVLLVHAGKAELVAGGDAVWQSSRAADRDPDPGTKEIRRQAKPVGKKRSPSTLRRLIDRVEHQIGEHDAQRRVLTDELRLVGSDHVKLTEIGANLVDIEAKVGALEQEWLELSVELEHA